MFAWADRLDPRHVWLVRTAAAAVLGLIVWLLLDATSLGRVWTVSIALVGILSLGQLAVRSR